MLRGWILIPLLFNLYKAFFSKKFKYFVLYISLTFYANHMDKHQLHGNMTLSNHTKRRLKKKKKKEKIYIPANQPSEIKRFTSAYHPVSLPVLLR